MMGPDGSGGGVYPAAAPAAPPPPPPSSSSHRALLRKLSVRHEQALLVQWDAEEQSTLDFVLSKLPVSKHSALERYALNWKSSCFLSMTEAVMPSDDAAATTTKKKPYPHLYPFSLFFSPPTKTSSPSPLATNKTIATPAPRP